MYGLVRSSSLFLDTHIVQLLEHLVQKNCDVQLVSDSLVLLIMYWP